MKVAEARRWVDSHFGTARRFEASERRPLSEDDFAAVLDHLGQLPKAREKDRAAIERFLYAGCRRFNRWFAPSPPSVPTSYRQLEMRFAKALSSIENIPMNAPVFLVHALRDELYDTLGHRPLPVVPEELTTLENLCLRLEQIPIPEHPTKKKEMLGAKSEVAAILAGVRSGTLRTRLKTNLPYPLTRCPLELRLRWDGLDVAVRLISEFKSPSQTMVKAGPPNVIRPMGTTRWQYGSTAIEIEFPSLLDPSLQVPAQQMPAMETPIDAWPNGLRAAYDIIYQVCWALAGHEKYIGTWIPAPADLGDIESVISIPGRADIGLIRRAHPSMVFDVFTPSAEVLPIDLGLATELEWFERCRVLADQYALLGEAREAIFWLNVGVEALLRTRMEAHIEQSGSEIDLDVLDGGRTYWDDAKQLVAAKFPELAEEISWPVSGKKPSLFQQLKFYSANVPGAPPLEPTKRHYSKVSLRRNDLFHGSSNAQIPIEDVKVAMESFDWLVEYFSPSTSDDSA